MEQAVILVIESDPHLRRLMQAEMEGIFQGDFYESLDDVCEAWKQGKVASNIKAAVVEMKNNTKDELIKLMQYFSQLPEIPIFLTLNYNCDFQLQEGFIRSWTNIILFRPFEADKLVYSIKAKLLYIH